MKIEATSSEFANSLSYIKHKKQRFWQVLFPVGLGMLLIMIMGTLIVLNTAGGEDAGNSSVWADTALIWLILPVMVFAVMIAVLLIGLIYLVGRGLKILPPYAYLVQQYVVLISKRVRYWSDKLLAPIMGVKSFSARMRVIFSTSFGRSRN